jgi:tRNA(Ile)-lysidine synthase
MCILDVACCARLAQCRRLWVGFSGGLDSTVLLHALISEPILRPKLHVVHVHHGLSPFADAWQRHVEALCASHHVACITERVTLNTTSNLEEAAREARLAVFNACVDENDCLLLAHHQDDQAETVLLHLLRGTGIDGLAAMQAFKSFGRGFVARPFLNQPRAVLEAYAKTHALTWVDDESNQNTQFSRNYIRHEILPRLKTRWPRATQAISTCAQHAHDARQRLDALAHIDCPELSLYQARLNLKDLYELSRSRLNQVLRVWLKHQQIKAPSTSVLEHLVQDVVLARPDARPCIRLGDVWVRRYRDVLYVEQEVLNPSPQGIRWDTFPKSVQCTGRIFLAEHATRGLYVPPGSQVSIRFRQDGDKLRTKGQVKSLKKLFQTWGVPPWLRDTIPLILIDGVLAEVLDFAIADDYYKAQGEGLYSITVSEQERVYDTV